MTLPVPPLLRRGYGLALRGVLAATILLADGVAYSPGTVGGWCWDAVPGASYALYGAAPGQPWELLTATVANCAVVADPPNPEVWFKVQAVDPAGVRPPSPLPPCAGPCGPP